MGGEITSSGHGITGDRALGTSIGLCNTSPVLEAMIGLCNPSPALEAKTGLCNAFGEALAIGGSTTGLVGPEQTFFLPCFTIS